MLSLEDTQEYVAKICEELKPKTVILLKGPMGAGKTQIVRFFCEYLSAGDQVSSPTFSIINEYENKIIHLDLYRLNSLLELENTGFWDAFQQSDYVFIEWADKFPMTFPKNWKVMEISISVQGLGREINTKIGS